MLLLAFQRGGRIVLGSARSVTVCAAGFVTGGAGLAGMGATSRDEAPDMGRRLLWVRRVVVPSVSTLTEAVL